MDILTSDSSTPSLTPAAFHILLALAGGEAHGYAMMSQVHEMTSGRTRLGPGTLYRSLFKLLNDGLIAQLLRADEHAELDERRRVYRLTDAGLTVARSEAARLDELVRVARKRGLLGHPGRGRRAPSRGAPS